MFAWRSIDADTFEHDLSELRALPTSSFYDDAEIFQNIFFIQHLYYLNKHNFEAAEQLVPLINEGLTRYGSLVGQSRIMAFHYNIATMYVLMAKYREALGYTESLMNFRTDVRQDIQVAARVLNLICHFEVGHHDLMESLTRSLSRYLMNQKRNHDFEKAMVKFLNEMPFQAKDAELSMLLSSLSTELDRIALASEGTKIGGLDDVRMWLKNRSKV